MLLAAGPHPPPRPQPQGAARPRRRLETGGSRGLPACGTCCRPAARPRSARSEQLPADLTHATAAARDECFDRFIYGRYKVHAQKCRAPAFRAPSLQRGQQPLGLEAAAPPCPVRSQAEPPTGRRGARCP